MSCSRTTTQWRRWGSNPRPFGLESSTLPLSHCATFWYLFFISRQTVLLVVQGAAELQFEQPTFSNDFILPIWLWWQVCHVVVTIGEQSLLLISQQRLWECLKFVFGLGIGPPGPHDEWCTAWSVLAEEEPLTSLPSTLNYCPTQNLNETPAYKMPVFLLMDHTALFLACCISDSILLIFNKSLYHECWISAKQVY